MLLPRLRTGCLLWVLLAWSATALAADKTPPGYKESVTQALNELEAGNYPEAREEFRRAHAIFPNARTLRGLGMVEFELRNYKESVRWLEEALSSKVKPLDDKLRQETELLLSRARHYLGELYLSVEPSTASVQIDGAASEIDPSTPVLLQVGEHVVEVRAPGRLTERRTINVEGETRTRLRIVLTAPEPTPPATAAAAAPRTETAPDTPPQKPPVYKRWWFWTSLVLVVAGGATAAAIIVTRNKNEQTEPSTSDHTVGVNLHTLRSF